MSEAAPFAACPACGVAPAADEIAARALKDVTLMLSIPGLHCAACIDTVERALTAEPGVRGARVNLTLKRAQVSASPGVEAARLVRAVVAAGYEAHELDAGAIAATATDRAGRDLLMRLAVAGFASMNVMLLSVSVWAGAEDATRDLFHWISAAITLPAIAFCAQPFFRNAWGALRVGRLNMDVPITLALVLALVTSLWEVSLSGEDAYFDAALTLTFFLLAGRYLDHRTRAMARSAAEELAALEVPRAVILRDGAEVPVPVAEVAIGDLVRVRPGGRMPVDGVVVGGESELDRSLLTGETLPVQATPGQAVSAGEVNLTGPLLVRATAVGRDTSLHRMADLVAIAESGRSRYTSLADRAARLYAPGVHILSALAFAGWWLGTGDLRVALNIAAAVLIITCPCALGLAVPAVTTAASGRLFRRGLLIKHETALERLALVDTVVFDKTGTLTAGVPVATNLADVDDTTLGVALALAQGSSHPLSRALVQALDGRVEPAKLSDLREVPGHGTEALLGDRRARLGRADWCGNGAAAQGEAPVLPRAAVGMASYLQIGGRVHVLTFEDHLRPGASQAIAALRAQGLRVLLLSGDAEGPVRRLAEQLGITDWQAALLPADKAARIAALQSAGAKVLMVGDGLNDTVALRTADVSLSPASALDAARVASDIVLLGGDLSPIPDVLLTASRAIRRIRENFRIATFYNVIAVPLAVAGFCSPLIAALAMSASSVTVSLNALRLR
ncbi:cadmium-translocating P-type ATPase [Pseudooceanicola sediminis]|uniref:Cadmium-translocating P-type ATPase n=1 Tax=Pseudooceanicola sediminis TaxID=2211117 RepID=A0A399IXE4_9RHOB|nr:heavy metal translocating P-type ATPase [Pseudooceanicola sediminis]KAA2312909.1 cadmium-translocating P-type ATPase [Puniceibacterium sp. HSS470]RII37691.1 cadmium-translocating P-type ATPase [Pseudooceanicola sediminis]|tara:strand:+ start:40571 stop:42778 length:2208 start_codon:yes stop_codon:yes gene_type:complete